MQELGDPKIVLGTLLRQPGASYWSVFDSKGKRGFSITLAGYDNFAEVSRLVYEREGVVLQASSIEELAGEMGVPAANLAHSIARYNELAEQGVDDDFQAFGPKTTPKPEAMDTPPFYAARFFPITRKSMGGVAVDDHCRVLSKNGQPIENLYAVGEVTGFAGINGSAALEGTFLGPAIYMGRVAGREIAREASDARSVELRAKPNEAEPGQFDNDACLTCHKIESEVRASRVGYWHFEQSHAKVLDRGYRCGRCHPAMAPFSPETHKLDRLAQTLNCAACHGLASERRAFAP